MRSNARNVFFYIVNLDVLGQLMPVDCTTVLKFSGHLQLIYIQKVILRIFANLCIYGVIGILVSFEKPWSIGVVVAPVGGISCVDCVGGWCGLVGYGVGVFKIYFYAKFQLHSCKNKRVMVILA